MRTGSWLLIAGLALGAVGIVTAPKAEREPHNPSLTLPMAGVNALDIGSVNVNRILLDAVTESTLTYQTWYRHRDLETPAITSSITEGVLTLKKAEGYWHDATLTVPSTLKHLHGNNLSVTAHQPVGDLRLEGHSVKWNKGTADTLDVHLHPKLASACGSISNSSATFTFEHGQINLLRIHAQTGTVIFEYIDQVGDIELHAGPSVRVQARHTDLPRIRILPLEANTDATLANWQRCREDAQSEATPDF